jgi:uncharacterized membrane protein YfcA
LPACQPWRRATSTFALWPGTLASAVAYRREVGASRRLLAPLGAISVAGGAAGGLLLVRTSDDGFLRLLPWLMLLAAATFTFSRQLTNHLGEGGVRALSFWALPLQLLIAVYGGYFGGGIGIMMLAAMAIAGMTNIHEMNALKTVLAVAINGVAVAVFVALNTVAWAPGLIMLCGGVAGGYLGAGVARRTNPVYVRIFVTVVAWLLTGYFFLK